MEHVLVVEDEASIRKALAMHLDSKDYDVDIVPDGKGGILLGDRKKYDILITDLCLPDMDGLEVIKQLKHTSPEIIPIIITGNGSLESSREAIRLEVSDYIEKPFSMESILNSISRGLEKRNQKKKKIEKKLERILQRYKGEFPGLKEVRSMDLTSEQIHITESISKLVHQINNPLMCIIGGAELGMFNLEDKAAVKEYLYRIISAAEEIEAINKEIWKLKEPIREEVEVLDVKDILDDCINMFNDLMVLKGVLLQMKYSSQRLAIMGNKFPLEQVFKNLILNSIDSMVDRPEKNLIITTAIGGDPSMAFITIRDTGCGIHEKDIDKIFTKYFTNKKHGTGLGLPVVKEIVEKHKGIIHVESKIGKGTVFTIELPVA